MIDNRGAEVFKLSILGGLPKPEICSRLNVDLPVADTAEALFFDIRDKRTATSWMACNVFNPVQEDGDIELAVKMRVAFFGGAVLARTIIDARENLPLDDAERLADQQVLLYAKLQAALEYRLTDENCLTYIKMFLDYELARKELDFAREKFQHECEVSRRQYEAERASNRQSEEDAQHDPESDTTGTKCPSVDDGDIKRWVA
jgi:hypothetical protein